MNLTIDYIYNFFKLEFLPNGVERLVWCLHLGELGTALIGPGVQVLVVFTLDLPPVAGQLHQTVLLLPPTSHVVYCPHRFPHVLGGTVNHFTLGAHGSFSNPGIRLTLSVYNFEPCGHVLALLWCYWWTDP